MKKLILGSFLLSFLLTPVLINAAEVLFLGPDSFEGWWTQPYYRISSDEITINPSSNTFSNHDFTAPIQLPEGAKISSMVIFYMDNQSGSQLTAKIVRQNRYDGTQQTVISQWSSTDGSGTFRNTKTTSVNYQYNKIVNGACTYHVQISFVGIGATSPWDYSDVKLYGVKIFYMPPTT